MQNRHEFSSRRGQDEPKVIAISATRPQFPAQLAWGLTAATMTYIMAYTAVTLLLQG